MLSRLQICTVDGILMEARPLGEGHFRVFLVLFVCPFEHFRLKGQPH